MRWFNIGGPDTNDNGLALCSLHHKLFDYGALGLDENHRIEVSRRYTARPHAAKRVYDLYDRRLLPRLGPLLPAEEHVDWHRPRSSRAWPWRCERGGVTWVCEHCGSEGTSVEPVDQVLCPYCGESVTPTA